MSKTEVSGKQIKDGSIELVDLSATVSNDINTLKSDVSTLQSDVSTIQGDVATLQTDVASNGSSVSGIDGRLGLLEADSTTKNYVDAQISNLINGSPAALNTLNELATALGNDANFSATVTGQISDISADVASLDGRVSSVESDVSTLQSDVAGKASASSLATVATSGAYADLTGKPSLFSGAYTDLTGKPSLATVATSGAYSDLSGTPSLAAVATSGSYNDLSDKPSFSSNLDGLTDVTITTPANGQVLQYNGTAWINGAAPSTFSGSYNDLSDKPSLFSGSYADLTGKPTLFDGAYASLTGKPSLFSGSYTDLTNKPSLFSGSYNDLTNKPTIPASLDDLSDVVITSASKGQFVVHNGTSFVNSSTIEASSAAVKPLIIKGAASQSANLFEAQNSSGTSLLSISNSGTITSGMFSTYAGGGLGVTGIGSGNSSYSAQGVYLNASVSAYGVMDMVGNNGGFIDFAGTNEDFHGRLLYDRGSHAYYFYTGANATAKVYIDRDNYGTLWVGPGSASSKGVVVQAAASQTANLFEAQNSSGTVLFSVDKDGSMAAGTVPVARVSGLATVATSGSYADLSNKPTIPSLTGYATEVYVDNKVSALVASAPAALDTLNELAAALGNDASFSTTITNSLAAKANTSSLATVATSGSYADLSNKPTLSSFTTLTSPASGQFLKYNGTAWVNSAVAYSDVTGTPTLATVATSGSYADLSNKPTIPGTSDGNALGATTITTTSASTKALIVKGAASQSASLLEVQNSSSQILSKVASDGSVSMYDTSGANGFTISNNSGSEKHTLPSQKAFQITQPGAYGVATTFSIGADDAIGENGKWQIRYGTSGSSGSAVNFRPGYIDSNRFGGVGIMVPDDMYVKARLHIHNIPFPTQGNYGDFTGLLIQNYDNQSANAFELQDQSNNKLFAINKQGQVQAVSASTKALVVKAAASQTANVIEAQDSSGNVIFAVTPSNLHTTFNGITSKETNATVTTTNATETTLFSLTLADNTTYNLDVMVCARLSSTTAKGMYGRSRLMVYRNNAGVATIAADFGGQLEELDTYGTSGYDYVVDVSGNDVRVRVTGAASETVKWAANVKYVSVS